VTAAAGDVVSLQGANFGSAPVVVMDGAPSNPLQIVNNTKTNWLAVQIPASAKGALILRISNATGTSAQVKLNAAVPVHLDAMQLVPGGVFRVFGRNLLMAGSAPSVTVNGQVAALDLSNSNGHMLMARAPTALLATAAADISVDNGNGSGPASLDRTIAVVPSGGADVFGLGVGWASAFAPLATKNVNAATDSRLSPKMVCNGSTDDTLAVQSAIALAASGGGGVVQLKAGRCRLAGTLTLKSNVVLQGAGMNQTTLVYEANYPLWGVGIDLAGLRDLSLVNAGSAAEAPLLKNNTRVFLQNVGVQLGTSRQMYLSGNTNIVVTASSFVQTGSISNQAPYTFTGNAGLVFVGNTTNWMNGAPTFGQVHDSYIQGNHFTRDGAYQSNTGTVHSFTVDFAYRIAVVGNTFDVANGPITNKSRNDGETILTEGGGGQRTENLGTVASATATTLSDPTNTLNVDPFSSGTIPEDYGVAIVSGTGAGQTRRVVAYSQPTMTVDRAWDVVPDSTSNYATFVWGLEKSIILGNNLSQNPRGVWLYQTAVRDVEVSSNVVSQGGGIFLRSYQNLSAKQFMPIYNVLITQNQITNSTGQWMSYINSVFVNGDAQAFGIATLGIEMRANAVTANIPNISSNYEDYANAEGYMNMMRLESSNPYQSSVMPRLLGTILNRNSCTNCGTAIRIGTGAGGTTILNTQLVNSPIPLADWATTNTSETSTNAVQIW
jgi:hypothetical protein